MLGIAKVFRAAQQQFGRYEPLLDPRYGVTPFSLRLLCTVGCSFLRRNISYTRVPLQSAMLFELIHQLGDQVPLLFHNVHQRARGPSKGKQA